MNPKIKTIPEIYPGIEAEAVRVGADVYSMYGVVDAIAHEYEFGNGDHMASSRKQLDWLRYQAGMQSFRAFAEGKATWILNYSWDGDKVVEPKEAMRNLAASQIMVGANFWDAPGHPWPGRTICDQKGNFSVDREGTKRRFICRDPDGSDWSVFFAATRNFYAARFLRRIAAYCFC